MAPRKSPPKKQAPLPEELEPLSISRLQSRARCSAAWFLRYRLKKKSDFTAHHLMIGSLIHEAIERYYDREFDSVVAAAKSLLPRKLKESGLTPLQIRYIKQVADIEADILGKFQRGEITKPDGTAYTSPKMTKAYKDLAQSMGLNAALREVSELTIGDIKNPPGGIPEIVARILYLAERYQSTMLIPREQLEWARQEEGFDFVDTAPDGTPIRFLGYMDLVAKVKPEFRSRFGGKSHILIDYKSGRAHDEEEHRAAADASMQLSLYNHVVTKLPEWNIPADDLFIALHYIDAAVEANTERDELDYKLVCEQAAAYTKLPDSPGMIKRHGYDGDDCQKCEYRQSCIEHFGHPTTRCGGARGK